MIFGKIDPVVTLSQQTQIFNPQPEIITGSYVTAVANQYALGANQVNFRVLYGNCTFESGSVTEFNVIHADNVTLSGADIDNWGTDDSTILDAIAIQQGTSVVEVVSGSANGFGF